MAIKPRLTAGSIAADLQTGHGSITSAHASVGAAATWPTTGTIFKPAEATRHGAAARPQPARPAHSATSTPSAPRRPIRRSRSILRVSDFMGTAPAFNTATTCAPAGCVACELPRLTVTDERAFQLISPTPDAPRQQPASHV